LPKERSTVLIVDDTPASIKILNEALSPEFDVVFALDGREGLEIARQCRPDLILLDVVMPGVDGYEVCRRLREDERTKTIPVIFVTARTDAEAEEYGLNLGAVDYVTKPYQLPIVRARVRNHVSLKRKADLLESLASLDGLTGIPNRRRFDQILESEWKRSARTGAALSVLLLDVDYFKQYNDHFGHGAGDRCLKQIAATVLSSLARPADIGCRYGGEEFAAVLPDTDLEGARQVAERVRRQVEALAIPQSPSSFIDRVTISIG